LAIACAAFLRLDFFLLPFLLTFVLRAFNAYTPNQIAAAGSADFGGVRHAHLRDLY
jgi:hypothetical protein